jgi:hypothetical protein
MYWTIRALRKPEEKGLFSDKFVPPAFVVKDSSSSVNFAESAWNHRSLPGRNSHEAKHRTTRAEISAVSHASPD